MDWTKAVSEAVSYMESHLTEDITLSDVAGHVAISPFYFHRGFTLLCGYSVMEYVRSRRMARAGEDLLATDATVTELAMRYGYDSPDSFTKAFTRFHGSSPLAVRRENAAVKAFPPLKLAVSLKGGCGMEYRMVKKEAFSVCGVSRVFRYSTAKQDIPLFWEEHFASGKGKEIFGRFGVNIDPEMGHETFEYLIADLYDPGLELPAGTVVKTIPAFTWAVFPCRGALSHSLQSTNIRIFSEWLPALRDYEFAAGYCVELYDDPAKYPNGTADENYYAEIWLPVRRK